MFLVRRDFNRQLNSTDMSVLLEETAIYSEEVLNESIDFAIEYVKSKIQHRYDPDQIFIDVNAFALATAYAVGDLVLYEETAFDSTATYVVDDRVSYNNFIYKANTSISAGAFNSSQWDLVTNNSSYYYCIAASTGNYPENTTYFTKGDNRNALIRDYTIKIAIKELFLRVQPRVIPEWTMSEAEAAENHLNRISKGTDSVLLPVKTDADGNTEGDTFRYGSETQKDWSF